MGEVRRECGKNNEFVESRTLCWSTVPSAIASVIDHINEKY